MYSWQEEWKTKRNLKADQRIKNYCRYTCNLEKHISHLEAYRYKLAVVSNTVFDILIIQYFHFLFNMEKNSNRSWIGYIHFVLFRGKNQKVKEICMLLSHIKNIIEYLHYKFNLTVTVHWKCCFIISHLLLCLKINLKLVLHHLTAPRKKCQ